MREKQRSAVGPRLIRQCGMDFMNDSHHPDRAFADGSGA